MFTSLENQIPSTPSITILVFVKQCRALTNEICQLSIIHLQFSSANFLGQSDQILKLRFFCRFNFFSSNFHQKF
jgi:hypothetical protein